jgi:hypothetical protein
MGKKQATKEPYLDDGCYVQTPEGHVRPMEAIPDLPEPQEITVVDPKLSAVPPFVASADGQAVATTEAVPLPPSRYRVSLAKYGFPRLNNVIEATDQADALRKFYAMHGIGRSEKQPEITLEP